MQAKPLQVGLIGAGNILKMHMEGIRRHPDRILPVALCDLDPDRLATAAAHWEIPGRYASVDSMLAEQELDVAVVLTPTHVRREVLGAIMEKRIPLFCEKPLAETYSEARDIAMLAKDLGVPVAVNQNFRRFFSFELARSVLAGGELGRPLHLTQTALSTRRDQGWRLERDRYVMSVMSVHWLDGYRFLFDQEPVSVYCRGPKAANCGCGETAVSLILDFPDGQVVNLSESFSSFDACAHARLDCESGSLDLDYAKLVHMHADKSRSELNNPYDKPEATVSLLLDLCDAAATGRAPLTGIEDNLNTMRVLEAAYRSLKENRVVKLKEIQ